MAKKMGKVILFGVVAGAAAAGVYHYLQSKDQKVDEYDDFDDLDSFDDTIKDEGAEIVSLVSNENIEYMKLKAE